MTHPPRGQFSAKVQTNTRLCRDHYRLVLEAADFPPTRPGQFIQIACNDLQAPQGVAAEIDWTPGLRAQIADPELLAPEPVLRRPFSLAGRRGPQIDIIHREVGLATRFLAGLKMGDPVSILGPMGNAFDLPSKDQFAILVGGGVGIPPMIYLASALARGSGVALAGALCRDLMPLTIGSATYEVAEFTTHGIPTILSTDDGSLGCRGFVTQALEDFLDGKLAAEISREGQEPVIYTCGPELMMKRVAQIAIERGIACQVAVERAMACGMGTCQSCCIRVNKPNPAHPPLPGSDWCYRLACTDGPIFAAAQLLW
jgi:dihydroorotate dehydrogenase electron transfer subunit